MNTDFSQRKLIGKYSKKYAYAPYLNEDIGWEMECLPGDDPMEVQAYLKSLSDKTHKINNPHLYQEQDTQYTFNNNNGEIKVSKDFWEEKPTQLTENQPLTQEQKIHNLITQSTSLPELKQWELLSNNKIYPSLKQAYENKLKELTK